jgi:hypothetical protein
MMFDRVPFPACARCGGKPVERLKGHGLDVLRGGYRFTATCHGQEEETILPLVLIHRFAWTIKPGVAFLKPGKPVQGQ